MKRDRKRINRNILYGMAASALVLLVFVFLSGRGRDNSTETKPAGNESFADMDLNELREKSLQGGVAPEELLADYKKWSVYPPNSRPLKPNHIDVLNHRMIEVPPQNMPIVKDGNILNSGYACRLQPLTHTVTEGGTMETLFYCQGGEGDSVDRSRTGVKIHSYRLTRFQGETEWETAGLELEKKSNNEYLFRFKPKTSDWGDMELKVQFEIPGDKSEYRHSLRTHFFSSPVAPARFLTVADERIEKGALVITVELDVKKPGNYTIEANLHAGEGPVAFARQDATLRAGRNRVELTYFGKIFHDRALSGPYTLKGLRGRRDNDAVDYTKLSGSVEDVNKYLARQNSNEPEREVIPDWQDEYTTEAYRLEVFSPAEYDSPLKQKQIAEYRALVKNRQN